MWACVCEYAHTHARCTDGVLDASLGIGMRYLEGLKNPDGPNLGIYVFVYMCYIYAERREEILD